MKENAWIGVATTLASDGGWYETENPASTLPATLTVELTRYVVLESVAFRGRSDTFNLQKSIIFTQLGHKIMDL